MISKLIHIGFDKELMNRSLNEELLNWSFDEELPNENVDECQQQCNECELPNEIIS